MSEQITLEGLIRNAIDSKLLDVHTAIVGIVDAVNSDSTVDVTVGIKRVAEDGSPFTVATLPDVPVMFFGNSIASISYAIKKGDQGMIIFNERDISGFVEKGKISEPIQYRNHEYSDAVFFPSSISDGQRAQIPQDGIRITGNLFVTGNITGLSETAPITLNTHTHTGDSGGSTSPPIVGT